MSTKVNILYFIIKKSEFTKKDIEFLSKHYNLLIFEFNPRKKIYTISLLILQLLFLIKNINKSDFIFIEFAGYHSFFPTLFAKLFNMPSLIMVGGTECYNMPSINYGNYRIPTMRLFTGWSFSLVTHCAPVHKSLAKTDYTYDSSIPLKQGYLNLYLNSSTNFTEICNGYKSDKFYFNENEKKIRNSFLTVATTTVGSVFYRKGVDLFIGVAQIFPDYKFTIIGSGPNLTKEKLPSNLELLPYVPNEKLREIYARHEFYVQLSMAEGHPNAMSEAMLCECVIIGSNVAGIPDILGDAGFILKEKNISQLVDLIKQAVISDKKNLGKKSRERIANIYPIRKREESFVTLIDELIINKKETQPE